MQLAQLEVSLPAPVSRAPRYRAPSALCAPLGSYTFWALAGFLALPFLFRGESPLLRSSVAFVSGLAAFRFRLSFLVVRVSH